MSCKRKENFTETLNKTLLLKPKCFMRTIQTRAKGQHSRFFNSNGTVGVKISAADLKDVLKTESNFQRPICVRPSLCGVTMTVTSTPEFPVSFSYDRGASNAVSPYITLSILVAGVLGGLVIVIAFILFCKYCVKKKHSQRRDQGTSCDRQSDRRFKPFQRIETINSDVFSEPSTGSMDGIPISPRKLLEAKSHEKLFPTEEPNENTKLKSDFDKTSYRETDLDLEQLTTEVAGNDVDETVTGSVDEGDTTAGRRVSFHLDNISPTHTGYLQKGRRYTEGDFHYLKKIRINKHQVPRQYSLGVQVGRNVNEKCTDIIELDTIPAAEEPTGDVYVDMETSITSRAHHHALDSPSPPDHNIGPRLVDVEIHSRTDPRSNRNHIDVGSSRSSPVNNISRSPRLIDRVKFMKPISHSLDAMTHSRSTARTNRRVKSYDDVLEYDYDVLKITEFSSGPFHNNHFDPISEVEALGSSKVRYNDMGSLEVLNEEKLYMYDEYEFENNIIPDESDADTETTLNGAQKYREIWNLRTTLEEEEECSDTVRMEDMASPDDEQSPDKDLGGASYSPTYQPVNEVAAQYQNNGELVHNGHVPRGLIGFGEPPAEFGDANLLHPNYEQRRDSYKKVLNRRYQKRGSASAENSFDSVETVDTDGDVSDTSRQEVTTTSFESTTDNTDSTNDSTNKLRQMKADSGYKSLETPLTSTQNGIARKSQSMDDEIVVLESSIQSASKSDEVLEGVGASEIVPRRGSIFEKRRGRTASKRRREYSKERQVVRLYESVYEPETDSARSDQPSGDSFEEPNTPSTKFSVFSRFFKSQKFSREKGLSRDFSIDEKTNNLFQEFVRYDPKFDTGHRGSTAGLKLGPESRRQRMQRKYTDPGPYVYDEISRHWLTPEMRSTSLGSDSSASSARKISPQDSIEEEIEDDIDAAVMDHKRLLEEKQLLEDKTSIQSKATTPTVSLHEIPIIKLPEGETVDV